MEKMFHWTAQAHNLRYVSLRYFNACGAHPNGQIGEAHEPETHLIPLILQVPNHKRDYISIFGTDYETKDGTCVRDYIHVNDLAQAHILAMKYLRDGNESDIFNLGNGVGFTVKEVIEAARTVTGHPIPAKVEPRRAGDPSTLIASSEKAKKILGWKPQYDDLETIIQRHGTGTAIIRTDIRPCKGGIRMINVWISELVAYGLKSGLVAPEDKIYVTNSILELLEINDYSEPEQPAAPRALHEILEDLTGYARERGILEDDTITVKDLFDTKLMGRLTPPPSVVRGRFTEAYAVSPKAATDYYYRFSQATNYIRTDRIARMRAG